MSETLTVERGSLLLYYCFDVGDEILLDGIEKIFGEAPIASRLVYERLTPAYVQYRKAPLLIEMGHVELATGKERYQATCQAKLYDFGVVTIIFKAPLPNSLQSLVPVSRAVVGNPRLQQVARAQLTRLLREISREIVHTPYEQDHAKEPDWEDYAIFSIERFNRPIVAQDLLSTYSGELARILRSEAEPLSQSELADATKQALSYYENELAIIDWNAAFLYDPRQSYDVPDVLEYAVAMLLELRTYDTLLDYALDKAYDDLGGKHSALRLRPFASTIDYLSEVKLDVSEVMEKATNSLKLVGDLYLARVFSAAATRFSLPTWEASVREKLTTVESLYKLLHDRTQNRLLLILELLIVLLFVVDILLLFVGPLVQKP
jgi:hypothetical protein